MKLPKELREKSELERGGKARRCSVVGCNKKAMRSLSENKYGPYLERAKLQVEESRSNKLYLCKKHYKAAEKIRKSEEKLFRKKGFLNNANQRKRDPRGFE